MPRSSHKSDRLIGIFLIRDGLVDARQLELARRRTQRQQVSLHRALIELNFISESQAYRALAEAHELTFVEFSELSIAPDLIQKVPVKVVLHYKTFPVEAGGGMLALAFAEPPTATELANLRLVLGSRIRIVIMAPSSIHRAIEVHYGLGASTVQKLREDRGLPASGEEALTFDTPGGATEDLSQDSGEEAASISKLVTQMLLEALRMEATDIHIEPYESHIRLRYRIDGLLRDIPLPAGLQQLYGSIVSRLKVMAGLNIAERRLPHDGRITMRSGEKKYDLRVSILPTRLGEAICLRVLSRNDLMLDFDRLGMPEREQRSLEGMMGLSQGMVLLTGPTGSGKTTTLYTALQHSRDEGRKVITVEDPVEYQMERISQIQVRSEIGLSFSAGLRSILRHDPDVVLIGEIRDRETADIAIRAAQTGHLVLSTLHTNDSLSAVVRLVEMGIEPFLVASSLVCSIAQRLVRRNCRQCAVEAPIDDEAIRREMAAALKIAESKVRAMRGTGCVECGQRGYRGREAVYEFFHLTEAMAEVIQPGLTLARFRLLAREHGWRSLRENAWSKVQDGVLSLEEHQRVTLRAEDVLFS